MLIRNTCNDEEPQVFYMVIKVYQSETEYELFCNGRQGCLNREALDLQYDIMFSH